MKTTYHVTQQMKKKAQLFTPWKKGNTYALKPPVAFETRETTVLTQEARATLLDIRPEFRKVEANFYELKNELDALKSQLDALKNQEQLLRERITPLENQKRRQLIRMNSLKRNVLAIRKQGSLVWNRKASRAAAVTFILCNRYSSYRLPKDVENLIALEVYCSGFIEAPKLPLKPTELFNEDVRTAAIENPVSTYGELSKNEKSEYIKRSNLEKKRYRNELVQVESEKQRDEKLKIIKNTY
jgi:hypothetical protein